MTQDHWIVHAADLSAPLYPAALLGLREGILAAHTQALCAAWDRGPKQCWTLQGTCNISSVVMQPKVTDMQPTVNVYGGHAQAPHHVMTNSHAWLASH